MVLHCCVEPVDGRVKNGLLLCNACAHWYPVIEYLLELVEPRLLDKPAVDEFVTKFAQQFAEWGVLTTPIDETDANDDLAEQLLQREHFDWYAERLDDDYKDYAEMPFWRAVDVVTFEEWQPVIDANTWFLDVGCANGRASFPLATEGKRVVGFDISKSMIRQAINQAKQEGRAGQMAFFVADGSSIPIRSNSFDVIQTYGVLHHLPDPKAVMRDIQRALRAGGIHLGSENNESAFRGIFDLFMKWLPIWIEEAGEEPLLSKAKLDNWIDGLPVALDVETRVFLPPHLYNVFGKVGAKRLLLLSDAFARAIPWLGKNGGLIIFTARRLSRNEAV